MFYQLCTVRLNDHDRTEVADSTPIPRTMVPLLQDPEASMYSVYESPTPDGPWEWIADFMHVRHAQAFLVNAPGEWV